MKFFAGLISPYIDSQGGVNTAFAYAVSEITEDTEDTEEDKFMASYYKRYRNFEDTEYFDTMIPAKRKREKKIHFNFSDLMFKG